MLLEFLPKMFNPILFNDFLIKIFSDSENVTCKILSIECLVILVQKQSIEIDNYYPQLY